MLCPFNRRKMALSQDLAVLVAALCFTRCSTKVSCCGAPSPAPIYLPCHVEDASRAQHPSGMEPNIGDFAPRQGCVGKGESVSWMPAVPELMLHRDCLLQTGGLDPPGECLWVKGFARPKSSDIFSRGRVKLMSPD